MNHDIENYLWLGKTVVVGTVSGAGTLASVLVAQGQNMIPADTGSVAAILAGGIAAALGSMIYLFQLDKKNSHDLKMAEQETRKKELENEAQKSHTAAADRKSREDALMQLAIKSHENLQECAAERRILQERITYLLERSGPVEGQESITDSSVHRKFIRSQANHSQP